MATFDEFNERLIIGPPVADFDPLRLVFTWACPVPMPIVWRAHYMPPNEGASADMPVDMGREVGVWGETCVYQETDRTAMLTVRFLASAPTVGLIELAAKANQVSLALGGPANRGQLSIADLNTPARTLFARDAVLQGPCKRITFSGTAMVHEYVFLLDGVDAFLSPLLG